MSNDGTDSKKKGLGPEDEAHDAASLGVVDGDDAGGTTTVEMTEEQMMAMLRREQVGVIAQFVNAFAELPLETVWHISEKFLDQQAEAEIGKIIIDATDKVKRVELGIWGFRLYDIKTKQVVLQVLANKNFAKISDPAIAANGILTLGLVLTPALRAILYAHGYGVSFVQGADNAKIIFPKG